jgi:hypothetical protein
LLHALFDFYNKQNTRKMDSAPCIATTCDK